MKNFRWWSVIGLAAATLALSGCGGGGGSSSGDVSLRVANATLTHASVDLLVNSSSAATATAADTVSAYVSPPSGSVTLQVNDAGSSTALATTVPTLTSGRHYTLLTYESGGAVKTAVLNEDYPLPTAGSAQIRVYDAAIDAGPIDVYVTDQAVTTLTAANSPTTTLTNITANTSSAFFTFSPGTYRVRITAAGNQSDLRADVQNIVVTSQQIATVALTPSTGGSLINGSTLIQQGGYAAARNTNTRVRLAAAVTSGSAVTASAGGQAIGGGAVAPAFDFSYTLVPAGSALNITAGGQSVAAPADPLVAGTDVTLLVYNDGSVPTAKLLPDDNRLPTDATTVKLRMINGLSGTGTLTLTANNAPVGIGIGSGGASSFVAIASSTNATVFGLTSSVSGTLPTNPSSSPLTANKVYSVLVGADGTATPQLLIRTQ